MGAAFMWLWSTRCTAARNPVAGHSCGRVLAFTSRAGYTDELVEVRFKNLTVTGKQARFAWQAML
jgi:hypothetical protein